MSLLRLAVLDPPEVYHDGSRLTFALRKAQALLLYLAVEGGLHPRSQLAAFGVPLNMRVFVSLIKGRYNNYTETHFFRFFSFQRE
jgi:hypothetical protein